MNISKKMERKLLLIIALFLSSIKAQAQIQKDTVIARIYMERADSLTAETKYSKANEKLKKSLAIYESIEAWEKTGICYNKIAQNSINNYQLKEGFFNANKALQISEKYLEKENKIKANAYDNLGYYYLKIDDYNNALIKFEESLKIKQKVLHINHPDIASSLSWLGMVYKYQEMYDISLDYYMNSLKAYISAFGENHVEVSKVYNQIALINFQKGDLDESLIYMEKSLKIKTALYGKGNPILANSYNNIGYIYMEKELYKKALDYYKMALNIKRKEYGENHIYIANLYVNIGMIYEEMKMFDKALDKYEKALSIQISELGENHSNLAKIYNNIGIVFGVKGEYDKALRNYQKAIDILKKSLGNNHSLLADFYQNMAKTYRYKGEFKSALIFYDKALEIQINIHGKDHVNISLLYCDIGTIYRITQMYDKAIEYQEKALFLNLKPIYRSTKNKGFNPHEYQNLFILSSILNEKAKIFKDIYKHRKYFADIEKSAAISRKLDTLINIMHQSIQTDEDKIAFSEKVHEHYAGAIETLLLMYHSNNKKNYLHEAYDYVEKSKGNILKEILAESKAKDFSGLPNNLIELEQEIKTNKSFLLSQIVNEQARDIIDSVKINAFESKIFELNRKQDSLIQIFERKYPKYYKLKYKENILKVPYIQEQIDRKTTLLNFFSTDSIIYTFYISKESFHVKEIPINKLNEKIIRFRESIISQNITNYKILAYSLYQDLIKPITKHISGDQLIVSPDGPLWHLNFDLLLTNECTAVEEIKELPYMLKDYAISYTNSANLLFTQDDTKPTNTIKRKTQCLAFSFSDSMEVANRPVVNFISLRNNKHDLPGTRKEISTIANIVDGKYYYGVNASENNFKKNAAYYDIIHLALHGDLDHLNPNNSKLYFTKGNDSIEDGFLYNHELFAMNIPAKLVVLSACNTGAGVISKGEGIRSLGYAFQYAGAKSLLLSSWQVSDKSAPILIESFYKNLSNGMNKSKALQKAKLNFIQQTDFQYLSPFYWGNFYILGNNEPINIEKSFSITYLMIGSSIFILILLSVYFIKKT